MKYQYEKYRGKCKEYCDAAVAADSTLTLVRGHYWWPVWDRNEEHWWTTRPDGTIYDPTVEQFPSLGCGEYTPFNGIVECAQCGKEGKEEEDYHPMGNYICCSSECCASSGVTIMFLINIDIAYHSNNSQGHLYKAFVKDACDKIGITLIDGNISLWGSSKAVASSRQLALLSAADPGVISVEVVDEINSPASAAELPQIVNDMVAKLEQISSAYGNFNGRCEVHMPGNEGACSDVLQESLNKGWRITSAQPQPDPRRPDYILGRYPWPI